MYVVGLLILVGLMVTLLGKHASPYARLIIGAVFGMVFLLLWPRVLFYARLVEWPELYTQISWLTLCVLSTLIAVAFTKLRQALPMAIVLFCLFVLSAIASFSLDVPVKQRIALLSGLFDQPALPTGQVDTGGNAFNHPAGFALTLPAQWQLLTDKGAQFPYFQFRQAGQVLAELRPVCFDREQTALADILLNYRQLNRDSGKVVDAPYCFRTAANSVSCKVAQAPADTQQTRLHWLFVRDDIVKGVDLDFVIYRDDATLQKSMQAIRASLRAAAGNHAPADCLGSVDWF